LLVGTAVVEVDELELTSPVTQDARTYLNLSACLFYKFTVTF